MRGQDVLGISLGRMSVRGRGTTDGVIIPKVVHTEIFLRFFYLPLGMLIAREVELVLTGKAWTNTLGAYMLIG